MNREKIIKELRKHKEGYTISELARALGISRHTVEVVFAYLEGAGKVSVRRAGMARIYYLKE